jgi:hypothetical protein
MIGNQNRPLRYCERAINTTEKLMASLIFQFLPCIFAGHCRSWHLKTFRLPKLHRADPSASLDKSAREILFHEGYLVCWRKFIAT